MKLGNTNRATSASLQQATTTLEAATPYTTSLFHRRPPIPRAIFGPGPGLQGQRRTRCTVWSMSTMFVIVGRLGPSPALRGEFKAPNFAAVTPKICPRGLFVRGRTPPKSSRHPLRYTFKVNMLPYTTFSSSSSHLMDTGNNNNRHRLPP